MIGPPYCSYPATASTIRSGPISFGFSVTIRMPVLIPAETMIGLMFRYLMIPLVSECIISGTTDAMITSLMSCGIIFLCSSMPQILNPYSSEVLERFVVIRNVPFNVSFSNTPNVILVFPTSIVNSIFFQLLSEKEHFVVQFQRFKQLFFCTLQFLDLQYASDLVKCKIVACMFYF